MKKNLFLLFSIYFFVIQPAIVGFLRGEANFFWLGIINLLAIILIGLLYIIIEKIPDEEKIHEQKTIKEPKVIFHDHLRGTSKDHKKKSELILPFAISLLVVIGTFFMLQYNAASIEIVLLLSLVLGGIIFVSLTLILRHRFTKRFWELLGVKIYIILLLCSLIFTGYDYYQNNKYLAINLQTYIKQNIFGQTGNTDDYVFTGQGSVLGTGETSSTDTQETFSDMFSGMTIDSDIQEEVTGTVLGTSTDVEEVTTEPETTSDIATTKGNQKIMDAVIYLLKKQNISLITKHDLSFTYVSFKNENYDYWRTAYANKLIGKTTNPSKYIVCESYIVMKGILEGRNVPYTSSTVLTKFRAEAQKRNALNGCVKGKIVTDETL